MEIPTVKILKKDYETITIICPFCKEEVIYNRSSDLGTLKSISHLKIKCQKCEKTIYICGDCVNPNYLYLYYDSFSFIDNKKYMLAIIILNSSLELFLTYAIRVNMIYKPYKFGRINGNNRIINNIDELNMLTRKLNKELNNFGFYQSRNLFFNLYLKNEVFDSFYKIQDYITIIGDKEKRKKELKTPSDKRLKNISEMELSKLLLHFKKTNLNKIRNDIVHEGYRPSKKQTLKCKEDARKILFDLREGIGIEKNKYFYLF